MSDRDLTARLEALADHAARAGTLGPAADVRRRGDQRRRTQQALTGALGAVVVVALGAGIAVGQRGPSRHPGPPAGAATASAAATNGTRRWAGTKQFMQVQSGRVSGGAVTLQVRPAKKVTLGESFETQPIPGPYTTATVPGSARILSLDGESGSPEAFVGTLGTRTAQQRGEAFDITFDATGTITLIEWLYVP